MNHRLATFFVAALGCQALSAQEPPAAPPADQPALTARTFIPGTLEVKPFTPPVPVVRPVPPPVRILASVSFPSANGTTFTLQRGEPSTEPDLPPPPPPRPYVAPRELTPEEIARQLHRRRHTLSLGASVYDHRVSVVSWRDPVSGASYQAVCGFDLSLLAGVGRFVHQGEGYMLMLVHSNYDTTRRRRLTATSRLVVPEAAPGEIRITRGDAADEIALTPIIAIRDVLAAEQDRLIPYQTARAVHSKAAAAWHAAHPPIQRDETIIFRPHRGSRYLPKH